MRKLWDVAAYSTVIAQELRNDFNSRLELLTTLTAKEKLKAILTLEADYYRYYDYLDLASVELIEQINQLKNETLSTLSKEESWWPTY